MAQLDVFTTILNRAVSKGINPSVQSAQWFRDTAANVRNLNPQDVIAASANKKSQIEVGNMYLFSYDPKTKDTLPFYDRFPLIFPFERVSGGFYGINMHYLPPTLRAQLMDALYGYMKPKELDEKSRLQISYKILSATSKTRMFRPCVKRYLNSHVRSRLIKIDPKAWDIALFLPLQRFEKADVRTVYANTRKQLN